MKVCFVDCETTGTSPDKHGLIQIAGSLYKDRTLLEQFNIRMAPYPTDTIEDEALKVNGITREKLAEYQPAKAGYTEFTRMLGKHIDKFNRGDKAHFVGYNGSFDADMIRAWFVKANDQYFGSWFYYPIIDVAVLAGVHLAAERHRIQNFKLGTVAAHLGIALDEKKMHDAQEDIRITMEIFKRFAPPVWSLL